MKAAGTFAGTGAEVSRRAFLQATLAAGGTLVLQPAAAAQGSALGPFIRILPDNRVAIGCRNPEIGQGVRTAMPMLIAEELDLRWQDVVVEQLPLGVDFLAQPPKWLYGEQGAGGSTSIPEAWADHRQFGADARALLVAAAAARWGAQPPQLSTRDGQVHHPDGRRLRYADLAAEAAALPPPAGNATPKDPRDFRIVGRPHKVVDARDIVTGRTRYGIDSAEAGALVAVMARCPYFEGHLEGVDDSAARIVPGVVDVVRVPGPKPGDPLSSNLAEGVAVVARDTWAALRGRAALRLRWHAGAGAGESAASFDAQCRRLLDQPGRVVHDAGDPDAALSAAARVVEATYQLPFGAHAPMEPPNAYVKIEGGRALVVASLQQPGSVPRRVMEATGITRDKVEVHMTRAGGGFGRRLTNDFVFEAAFIAKACGRPVHLLWTRDDDLQQDFYRPGGHHRLRAALDAGGRVTAWHHKLASASKYHRRADQKSEDHWRAELYPDDFPARLVPNLRLEWCAVQSTLPRGSWRAPAHWANAFVVQSFIDEVAHATGQDALALRLALLGDARKLPYGQHGGPEFDTGRLAAVLQRVAEAIGWTGGRASDRSARRGLGLACHFTFGGYAAHAVQVQVGRGGELKIERVVCAVDCGRPINPLGIEAQMQGGTLDGLAAALLQEITLEGGRVVQKDFASYPLLPQSMVPPVEVLIEPSEAAPAGCGEMGVATIAPALTNAVFNACGVRLRRLPVKQQLREALAAAGLPVPQGRSDGAARPPPGSEQPGRAGPAQEPARQGGRV